MPYKPQSRCTKCRKRFPGTGLCPGCKRQQHREINQRRGSATAQGYGVEHRERFRAGVLERDPWCVLCYADGIPTPATVADHWPLSRKELEAQGLDPNDPLHGRGLCASCHSRETARNQPGGWNRPRP